MLPVHRSPRTCETKHWVRSTGGTCGGVLARADARGVGVGVGLGRTAFPNCPNRWRPLGQESAVSSCPNDLGTLTCVRVMSSRILRWRHTPCGRTMNRSRRPLPRRRKKWWIKSWATKTKTSPSERQLLKGKKYHLLFNTGQQREPVA